MEQDIPAIRTVTRPAATAGRLSMQYLRRASRRRLATTGALLAMIALAAAFAG